MLIISRVNEKHRWKRIAKKQQKKTKRQKGARGTEPIVNGWELKASLIFKSNLELA